jgi:hypothetical protein
LQSLCQTKANYLHQLLVGSMVIGVELGREDHDLIPRNCDQKGVGTT